MSIYKRGRPHMFCPDRQPMSDLPHKPGEYRILDDKGIVLYVGETNDIARRASEHKRTGKLCSGRRLTYQLADGRSTSVTRRIHERAKIKQHKPRLNKSGGGEGRVADRRKQLG